MLPAVVRLIDQAGYSALVRHIKSGALSIVLSDLSFELLGASPRRLITGVCGDV